MQRVIFWSHQRLKQIIFFSFFFKNKEIHFQRWQTTYALTLEAGEKLLNTANLETKESVNKRISQLQDNWKDTKLQLGEMIKQFQSTAEVTQHFLFLSWYLNVVRRIFVCSAKVAMILGNHNVVGLPRDLRSGPADPQVMIIT